MAPLRKLRNRTKSKNKNIKKRLRTPTLTPMRNDKSRESGWDIFPHQLEQYQKRNPGIVPSLSSSTSVVGAPIPGPVSQKTRHARRAYIGNLPDGCTDNEIRDFFTGALMAIGGVTMPGEPVLSIYINRDKKFAFIEFRSVEECSNCMAFEGILWRGSQLRVRRPNDYNSAEAASLGPTSPNANLNLIAIGLDGVKKTREDDDTLDRIFIGGLPHFFSEEQVLDILRPFGEVKTLDLVKDKSNGLCKGYGFCTYMDPSITDIACSALNGFKLGERLLTVKRALISHQERKNTNSVQEQQAIDLLAELQNDANSNAVQVTRFIVLNDCLTSKELEDDIEFKDIAEDMSEMFGHYGFVRNICIPRLGEKGFGKVAIELDNPSQALAAKKGIEGKLFCGKPVLAQFLEKIDYEQLKTKL